LTDAPLSRPLQAASVPAEGLDIEVVASPEEREAVAALNDVLSVESLVARLHVRPFGSDGLEVSGSVQAQTTRTCVVTLEPFEEAVREDVSVRFSPRAAPAGGEQDVDEDGPDPLVGGVVDLGAVTSEFFTLGLDPYPRKPGAAFELEEGGAGAESPFAILRRLSPNGSGER